MSTYTFEDLVTDCSARKWRVQMARYKKKQTICDTWYAVAGWVAESVVKGKGIKIGNFARIAFPVRPNTAPAPNLRRSGSNQIQGNRSEKPSFLLCDSFAKTHQIVHKRNALALGQHARCEETNFSKLAIRYSNTLTKDLAFVALRDMLRRLGQIAGGFGKVSIHLGDIGVITSRERVLMFTFNPTFLQKIKRGVPRLPIRGMVANPNAEGEGKTTTLNPIFDVRVRRGSKSSTTRSFIRRDSTNSTLSSESKTSDNTRTQAVSKVSGSQHRRPSLDSLESKTSDNTQTQTVSKVSGSQRRRPSLEIDPVDNNVTDVPSSRPSGSLSTRSNGPGFQFPGSPTDLIKASSSKSPLGGLAVDCGDQSQRSISSPSKRVSASPSRRGSGSPSRRGSASPSRRGSGLSLPGPTEEEPRRNSKPKQRPSSLSMYHLDDDVQYDDPAFVDQAWAEALEGEPPEEDLRSKMQAALLISRQVTPANRNKDMVLGERLPAMSMSPVACRFEPFSFNMIGGNDELSEGKKIA